MPYDTVSVLYCLGHQVKVISVVDSLQEKLDHLQRVFLENSYTLHEVCWTLEKSEKGLKSRDPEENKGLVLLPLYGSVSSKIGRLVISRFELKPVYCPLTKIG